MKFRLTLLLIGILSISCFAQCNSELENCAVGFNEMKASSFSFLDSSLNDVKIVGYGEDTHGTVIQL